MINISEMDRQSSGLSLMDKIHLLTSNDIYIAENIQDYRGNAHQIIYPWWKKRFFTDTASIVIYNVGIRVHPSEEELENPNWFIIHDSSGKKVIYWNKEPNLTPAYHSFSEAQEEICLKRKDWLYCIHLAYNLDSKLSYIQGVRKNKHTIEERAKDSLTEKIKRFLPEPEMLPQPT